MSTTLSAAEIELSKQMGDYWAGTTTSSGSTTTVVDTALMAKNNDWIDADRAEMYDMITSGTYDEQERRISSLDNSTGTLTTLAHGGTIGSGVTYRVHRLFSASDKRRALVNAAKTCFPHLFAEVRDENLTVGNWLRDPSLEWNWTSSTANTYWQASTVTMTKTTTYPYYTRGSTSMKLDTAAGYVYQSDTENPLLITLAGKTVKFKCKAWCDTADSLRLGICYDGTNITYSDYHPGTSNWADESGYNHLDSFLEVEETIDKDPTAVSFRIYLDNAAATAYADDLRAVGPNTDRLYIADLNLAQDQPHQVLMQSDTNIYYEPWIKLHGYKVGTDDWLYLPPNAVSDWRLRVLGINYLDFYDTDGDSGTDWADTIAVDAPQLDILVAQAAIYLCNQKIVPNDTSGTSDEWKEARAYWADELGRRQRKFAMIAPNPTIHWS